MIVIFGEKGRFSKKASVIITISCDFRQFSGENMVFFVKANVMMTIFGDFRQKMVFFLEADDILST
jgi:hypothetical protein